VRDRAFGRIDGVLIGDQVAKRRAVLANRLVERSGHASCSAQRLDGLRTQPGALGDRRGRRRARTDTFQLGLGAAYGGKLLGGLPGIRITCDAAIASNNECRIHQTAYVENFRPRR
jgi:hypothetical protein